MPFKIGALGLMYSLASVSSPGGRAALVNSLRGAGCAVRPWPVVGARALLCVIGRRTSVMMGRALCVLAFVALVCWTCWHVCVRVANWFALKRCSREARGRLARSCQRAWGGWKRLYPHSYWGRKEPYPCVGVAEPYVPLVGSGRLQSFTPLA